MTSRRSRDENPPAGKCQMVQTARVALALYPEAGLLFLQARHPRIGGVILDVADLSDEALALLRTFAGDGS